MIKNEAVKLPYDHDRVASHVSRNLRRRGIDPDTVSREEATNLIREQCARWDMHEPPTPEEWRVAQVWCNALMMVDVAFGTLDDPNWREMPEGNHIGWAAGVLAEHLGHDPCPIEAGLAFLDSIREYALYGDDSVEARDTEVRRKHEGSEPTREQCMLGATLANAIKALRLAPKHDDLDSMNWTWPLADHSPATDISLAPGAAAVVSRWQGRNPQTLADARLLLETALDTCKQ